ncbi:unnamed protein product [Amoebophrya sp. A120]|nr:unnamed protein product [Amoebophrya sp. A120]|eukprot:GSA120T00009378001.1
MSSASSSSAAVPAGNGPAEPQLANQPTKITAENVLLRYKGSYEKWVQKIADLDRESLEGRLQNLDKRTANKMLASQVNIWCVLATRNLTNQRRSLPEVLRKKVMHFLGQENIQILDCRNADYFHSIKIARSQIGVDYGLVFEYYMKKILETAAKGVATRFAITDEIADGAPALRNGDRPRLDVVVTMLLRRSFYVYHDRELERRIDEEEDAPLAAPLFVSLGEVEDESHERLPSSDIADLARNARPTNSSITSSDGSPNGSIWTAFLETLERTEAEIVNYLARRLLDECATNGIPKLEVTSEVMQNAPTLPNGEAYPLTPEAARALHPGLGSPHCLMYCLHRAEKVKGFTLALRGERCVYSEGDALPFTLHVGCFYTSDRSVHNKLRLKL